MPFIEEISRYRGSKGSPALLPYFFLGLARINCFLEPNPPCKRISFVLFGRLATDFCGFSFMPKRRWLWRNINPIVLLPAPEGSLAVYQSLYLHCLPTGTFAHWNSLAAFLNPIILVLAAAFFLLPRNKRVLSGPLPWCGLSLFVLLFTEGVIASRGALLGLALGTAVLCLVAYRQLRIPERIVSFFSISAGALVLAGLEPSRLELGARLSTLSHPMSADSGRFLIWETSWKLLQKAPWFGIGPGTFRLAWAPFRAPGDGTQAILPTTTICRSG